MRGENHSWIIWDRNNIRQSVFRFSKYFPTSIAGCCLHAARSRQELPNSILLQLPKLLGEQINLLLTHWFLQESTYVYYIWRKNSRTAHFTARRSPVKAIHKKFFDSTDLLSPLCISICEQYLLPRAARVLLYCVGSNYLVVFCPHWAHNALGHVVTPITGFSAWMKSFWCNKHRVCNEVARDNMIICISVSYSELCCLDRNVLN